MTRYSKALATTPPPPPPNPNPEPETETEPQKPDCSHWTLVLEAAKFISPAAHSILKYLQAEGAEIGITEKGNYQLRPGQCPDWEEIKQEMLIPLKTEITNILHFARHGWVATKPPAIGEIVIYCKDEKVNAPKGCVTFTISETKLIKSDAEFRQVYKAKKVFGGTLMEAPEEIFGKEGVQN